MEHLSIGMPEFILPIFGGLKLTTAVPIAWIASAIIIVLMVVVRIAVSRFEEIPKSFQNLIELFVDWADRSAKASLHSLGGLIAPYTLVIILFIAVNVLIEMLSFKPAIASLGTTLSMALFSLFWINYCAFKKKGIGGRIKSYFQPIPLMAPIKMITDLAVPVSLACRLFGNVTAGIIIMALIYSVVPIIIPAAFSVYFNLFHMAIQAYIFVTLTLAFIEENIETLE